MSCFPDIFLLPPKEKSFVQKKLSVLAQYIINFDKKATITPKQKVAACVACLSAHCTG